MKISAGYQNFEIGQYDPFLEHCDTDNFLKRYEISHALRGL